tara:strand:+ start:1064 stop:1348 length:285 start_codon:yes stop_codon:yes gene_type:complete
MGTSNNKPILPKAYRTVGEMRLHGVNIKAYCEKCRNTFRVDLVALIMVKGPDYSLIGKHPPCRIVDCAGRCNFLVSASVNTPMITLDRWDVRYG